MDNCIFCKIVNREIPSYKIYEDDKTYAFLDIANDFYGHTLVIPKKHSQNALDTDTETLKAVIETVQKVSKHFVDNCGFEFVNLLSINEDVQHFHFHIIPRKKGDGVKLFREFEKHNYNLAEISDKLKLN